MSSILNKNATVRNQKTVFVCSECAKAFASKDELKNHMIQEHKFLLSTSGPVKEVKTSNTASNTVKNVSKILVKKQAKALKKVK